MASRRALGTFSGSTNGSGTFTISSVTLNAGESLFIGLNVEGSSNISAATWNSVSRTDSIYLRNTDTSRSQLMSWINPGAATGNVVLTGPVSETISGWLIAVTGVLGRVASGTAFGTSTAPSAALGTNDAATTGASAAGEVATGTLNLVLANVSYTGGTKPSSWGNSFTEGQTGISVNGATEGYREDVGPGGYTAAATFAGSKNWSMVVGSWPLAPTVPSAVANTSAGFTSPTQWTETAGGTAIEWYTPQLEAVTLAGAVSVNVHALESTTAANVTARVEIARVNNDGSSATVWAAGNTPIEISIGGAQQTIILAGADLAISQGQRLRVRVYLDDAAAAMGASLTATIYYDGTTVDQDGDFRLTFPVTLVEYVAFRPAPSRIIQRPAIVRAAHW